VGVRGPLGCWQPKGDKRISQADRGRYYSVNLVLREDLKKKRGAIAKRHTLCYICTMKNFDWNAGKNDELRSDRNIAFEEIVFSLIRGGLLDIIEHPNPDKYPDQKVFVVDVDDYVYLVPFVETEDCVFLKTIIPSRKMTKKYLGGNKRETQ